MPNVCFTCGKDIPDLWTRCVKCRKRVGNKIMAGKRMAEKEPTMQELDALVEKQMKKLPRWWRNESC